MTTQKNTHFDIIVLGDGSGATLARNLAQFGFKTALIGEGRPGGTCLNRGCIPSKKLIAPVFKLHDAIKTISKYTQLDDEQNSVSKHINFVELKKKVLQQVTSNSLNSKKNMEEGNIENLTYFASKTKFTSDTTLKLEDGTQLTFDKLIIATGSSPRIPYEISGIEDIEYDTSTEALFSQDELKDYTILGGGVIACELGALYAACGVKVTILATGNILRPIDDELKKHVEKYLEELGIIIHKKIEIEKVEEKHGSTVIHYLNQKLSQTHTTSRLLVALGVSPNTQELGLEHTSIPLNSRGFIQADSNFKVNDTIFAIGDCTGKSLLRHGAGFEAREVFRQIVLKEESALSQEYMPFGIYLGSSEVAGCGKTSQQLKKEGIEFETYSKAFEDTVYGGAKGLVGKVLIHYDSTTLEILGCHVFGPDAVNLNQIVVPYIEHNQTLYDLSNTISPHPSLAEALFTISIRDIVYSEWKKDLNK